MTHIVASLVSVFQRLQFGESIYRVPRLRPASLVGVRNTYGYRPHRNAGLLKQISKFPTRPNRTTTCPHRCGWRFFAMNVQVISRVTVTTFWRRPRRTFPSLVVHALRSSRTMQIRAQLASWLPVSSKLVVPVWLW